MRTITQNIQRASMLLAMATLYSVNASAAITPGPNWADSYSVNGKCYCATSFDHGIGDYTVDTPAGIKTVKEVCNKIGPGPGKGSNPVYNTVQCGHEPAHEDAIRIDGQWVKDEKVCPGRVDLGSSGCDIKGPKWDLSVFGGSIPTESDERCSVIGDTLSSAQSLFASQCSDFTQNECKPISVVGKTKQVCSSATIIDSTTLAIVLDQTTLQAENYARAKDSNAVNSGGEYRDGEVDVEITGDIGGGFNVGWTSQNEYLEFDIYVAETNEYTLSARVASIYDTGLFSVSVDDQAVANNISTPYTGNWQSYITLSESIGVLSAGNHRLKLHIDSGRFNLNWLELASDGAPVHDSDIEFQTQINGNDIKVTCVAKIAIENIQEMSLYINGSFVRTEKYSPYNWNVSADDVQLRNLPSGNHELKVIMKDKSNNVVEATQVIYID
jgi:hypothetical protein